jgi:hypothetical protein
MERFGYNMADFGISEGLVLAGTLASVAAAGTGAAASVQSANYNKQVANNNAQAALDQANYANTLKQMQLEKTMGAEQAAAGASGVSGDSLDSVEYNTLVMGKYDQLATTYEAKVQATRAQSEAQLDGLQGQNAISNGVVSALGSAARGASKGYNYSQQTAGVDEQPDMGYP